MRLPDQDMTVTISYQLSVFSVYFPNMKHTNRIVYNKINSGINKTRDETGYYKRRRNGITADGRGAVQ